MTDLVVISGASGGIGFEIARHFAASGIELALVGRAESITAAKTRLGTTLAPVHCLPADFNDPSLVKSAVETFLETSPARHPGVVLCASVLGPSGGSIRAGLADFETVYRVNVVGNLAVVQGALPHMLRSHGGRCVFFAGGGAAYAYPLFPAYALSKTATVRLVENLAAEFTPGQTGLDFVCLAPGAVATSMLARVREAGGTVKTTTQVAEPVNFVAAYLCSGSHALSGRYVHVRDDWAAILEGKIALNPDQFLLRRIQ